MSAQATITFSQAGVQPPVYVVTSLGDWETLEMKVEEERTSSGDLVFAKQFDNVAEGSYQYKIRIGEGHWVLDESKESATDEHGNRNNVVHVTNLSHDNSSSPTVDSAATKEGASEVIQQKAHSELDVYRTDSAMDAGRPEQLPSIPVPFVVVEKVADKDQPEYGHVEPEYLPSDAAKRAADPEPDFEDVRPDSSRGVDPPKSPEVPLVVVEKTDDKPAYGDDFGENATKAQKAAHDMRAADAPPDRLVISPDHTEGGAEEDQPSPLFPHEQCQADEPPPASPVDTIDEESHPSSADQTSSSEIINTPEEDESQDEDEDELNQCPLLPHESGHDDRNDQLEKSAPFAHEHELESEDVNELDYAPLLPHENGFHSDGDSGLASDDEDEFDRAPLLPHETGLSEYRGSGNSTNSGFLEDDYNMSPQHYGPYSDDDERFPTRTLGPDQAPTFSHEYNDRDEDDLHDGEDDDAPLLPHERGAVDDGSEVSAEDAYYLHHEPPAVDYEKDDSRVLFAGSGRANVFRTRSNSSSLPHKLPLSDADDENLDDPSLERFPTSRKQILERVASIGAQLPEDETIEDSVHSPQLSVFSQACSSVDLVPVKSYTSLASVPEADDSDEEEDQDVESLPSPITFGGARSQPRFARDPHATPMPDDGKQLGHVKGEGVASNLRGVAESSSEGESVGKNDGAKDNSNILSTLRDAIATPARILDPITPPLTPESKGTAGEQERATTTEAESKPQGGGEAVDDAVQSPPSTDTEEKEGNTSSDITPTLTQQPTKQGGNVFTRAR
ncbi:hypothetical protein N0V83_009961 [Neocucurbitaria cava]|uniref:AMP-activated protein kinase glycogen-binding domain-containing protein n=1 Tax=Neocucurbitaria cava TaxID=798079 RepID=A0A9W8Y0B9_9PLEO|nr:hypothetical protein N0V83_009961 [Neocucurbitaria cava]